jgi:hypothetical protein
VHQYVNLSLTALRRLKQRAGPFRNRPPILLLRLPLLRRSRPSSRLFPCPSFHGVAAEPGGFDAEEKIPHLLEIRPYDFLRNARPPVEIQSSKPLFGILAEVLHREVENPAL